MSIIKPHTVDYSQTNAPPNFLPRLPILSSQAAGWKNIDLAHYCLPAWEIPEIASPQHTIALTSRKPTPTTEIEIEGKTHLIPPCFVDSLGIFPAELPLISRWNAEIEFTHCYLDSTFLKQIAYESVNPDRIELGILLPGAIDPLIWQVCMSLKSVLIADPNNSCFYAESMATALAAHLLQSYSTRTCQLREYLGGLPTVKLNQAIEYINEHLHTNISLADLAHELGMSQYYLSRLFKQSMGTTPHTYLVQQRVERSQQLLKNKDYNMLRISIACGFANPSHFAKCFRRQVGISPREFRLI